MRGVSIEEGTKKIERIDNSEILNSKNPIIWDTNFLFVTFQFKIDLISEFERIIGTNYSFYIYEGTLDELKRVEEKKDKNKKFIPLIIKMLNIYGFKIIKSQKKYIDAQIIEDTNPNVYVATNDKELKAKLKKKLITVIYLRQKRYLSID